MPSRTLFTSVNRYFQAATMMLRHSQQRGGPISTLNNSRDDTILPQTTFSIAAAKWDLMEGSPMLPMVVAMLFIFGLLLTFHYVVSDAKHQAELRHRATALRAMAVWHCNSAPAIPARDRCLAQISSPDGISTQL